MWLRTYDVACKESIDFKGLIALFKRLEVPISHLETRQLFSYISKTDLMPIKALLKALKNVELPTTKSDLSFS